ncbi:MAG: 5-methylcytosine-specific restriction endonuclease system specificity protein McrC [Zoogloeaceae bacterium]|jgi:5-methylcytosine-specific restriction enzyme subunit McrC|nr:5-methylcytosine-specific restriction endonuclease system specificity protein McrC [Zoogloeaceae bacterium]
MDAVAAPGFVGRIPVRNLWWLMLYASAFRQRGEALLGQDDNPEEIADLVAEILAHTVALRLRRSLSFGWQHRAAVLDRVRGRIDLLATARHALLEQARVACRFDELSLDTPRNRYVRGALEKIAPLVQKTALAHRCRSLARSLWASGVTGETPIRAQIDREPFGRNDAADRAMLAAAKLAFDLALPVEATGEDRLLDSDRQETWVRQLFEKAIRGFYAVVLPSDEWKVSAPWLDWQITDKSDGMADILPKMKTDIVLDQYNPMRRIVIDTKFTSIVTRGWHRDETLKSGYIYQIYAYLRSQTDQDPAANTACGLMLHPAIDQNLDEHVVIQGHTIRFATVDLTTSHQAIRARLLEFVKAWDAFAVPA